MFEAWEFRGDDFDLAACREQGIAVAGVNERHPDVAVFPFLGPLAVRLLRNGGFDPAGRRIALLCDNPFAAFILAGLKDAGAEAACFDAGGGAARGRLGRGRRRARSRAQRPPATRTSQR